MEILNRQRALEAVLSDGNIKYAKEKVEQLRKLENDGAIKAGSLLAYNALLISSTMSALGIDDGRAVFSQKYYAININISLLSTCIAACLVASLLALWSILTTLEGTSPDAPGFILLNIYSELVSWKRLLVRISGYVTIGSTILFIAFLAGLVWSMPGSPPTGWSHLNQHTHSRI
jgi:hypothetical protein